MKKVTTRIGDFIKIYKGKKAVLVSDSQEGDYQRFIQIDDLRNNNKLKFTTSKGVSVNPNDIIIAWDGANAGTIGHGLSGIIGSTLAKIEIQKNNIIPQYLGWFLKGKFRYLRDRCTGATIPHISREVLTNILIPLPSIEDQKCIVKILDAADALRQKRKQAISLLDDYINSTFFNMFVCASKEKNIPLVSLDKLSSKITDGVHAKPHYVDSGIPFISVKNITTTKLKFENCKFVSLLDHQNFTKRCKAESGDILYTKVGATYGRACVVDTEKEFSLYVSVSLIKPKKDLVDPTFLKAVLNSTFVKRQADKSVKGAGVPDLHLIEIKKFKIPLPSMKEQKKFSKLVLDSELLKQKMIAQSEDLETQFKALMQKAFKGEL